MKVFVFLVTGFEEIEAIASIDILRRGGVEVTTVSMTSELLVEGGNGIKVLADVLWAACECNAADMLLLPGGGSGTENLGLHEELAVSLTEFAQQQKWIAAICAAPMVLGKLGLLINHEATCYPGCESALKGATLLPDPVVVSGKIITAKGPGYSIPFALEVLHQLEGSETAIRVAKDLLIH